MAMHKFRARRPKENAAVYRLKKREFERRGRVGMKPETKPKPKAKKPVVGKPKDKKKEKFVAIAMGPKSDVSKNELKKIREARVKKKEKEKAKKRTGGRSAAAKRRRSM